MPSSPEHSSFSSSLLNPQRSCDQKPGGIAADPPPPNEAKRSAKPTLLHASPTRSIPVHPNHPAQAPAPSKTARTTAVITQKAAHNRGHHKKTTHVLQSMRPKPPRNHRAHAHQTSDAHLKTPLTRHNRNQTRHLQELARKSASVSPALGSAESESPLFSTREADLPLPRRGLRPRRPSLLLHPQRSCG